MSYQYFIYFIFNILFFTVISISIYRLICSIEIENYTFLTLSISTFFFTDSFLLFYFVEHSLSFEYLNLELINIYILDIYLDLILNNLYFYEVYRNDLFLFENINNNYLKVIFFTKLSTLLDSFNFYFFSLQESVYIIKNETVLVFFRISNFTKYYLDCLTVYLIYPFQYTFFLTKLQCFCFSNLIIQSFEVVDLPVLFFFNSDCSFDIDKLYFFYLILIK
jgi:hypothetical protein